MLLHLQIIFYTGKNILMLYIIISALNIYFKPKEQSRYRLLTYGIYIILGVGSHMLITIPWINIFLNVILVYMLLINYIGSSKSKLFISCAWSMLTMIIEIIVVMMFVTSLGQMISDVIFDESTSFILIILYTFNNCKSDIII